MKKKLIIAGTRTLKNYQLLQDNIKADKVELVISGGAPGADALGIEFAKNNNIPYEVYPADWLKYGRAAGPIRNQEMVEKADCAIFFWDGWSKGTANCLSLAVAKGIPVKIVPITIQDKIQKKNEIPGQIDINHLLH